MYARFGGNDDLSTATKFDLDGKLLHAFYMREVNALEEVNIVPLVTGHEEDHQEDSSTKKPTKKVLIGPGRGPLSTIEKPSFFCGHIYQIVDRVFSPVRCQHPPCLLLNMKHYVIV